jgi:hypothetical protein
MKSARRACWPQRPWSAPHQGLLMPDWGDVTLFTQACSITFQMSAPN